MITGAFVAKRLINQNKIRRRAYRGNLSCRRDTDQQLAAGAKQFFGDQYGERGAYRATNNAVSRPFRVKLYNVMW